MYEVDNENNKLIELDRCKLSDFEIKEPQNFQEWVVKSPRIFGEELLVIQKEFQGFSDTNERPDVLALDKNHSLVVIEIKLDSPGRDVVWQALKYASYCSQLSQDDICDIFQQYLDSNSVDKKAENEITEFYSTEEYAELNLNMGVTQRIFLIAVNFPKEVTSTVLWLRKFDVLIECFRVTPYTKDEKLYLVIERIIPLKDAEDFIIGMDKKEKAEIRTKYVNERLWQDRKEFWESLLESINKTECDKFKNINPVKEGWISAGSGIRGVGFKFEVTNSYARADLYINRGSSNSEENDQIFNILEKYRENIDREFSGELIWDRMEGQSANRIRAEASGNVSDRDQWKGMLEFMVNSMIQLVKILEYPLTEVEKMLK